MISWKFAWLLVPLCGLAELAAQFYFSSRPPKPEDWRTVRDTIAALRQNGELVVVAPAWAEPNARYAFGDALMPLADVARADETGRKRAIEVSILGAAAPELAGWKLAGERRAGKFRIRVLDNPNPAHVLFDFVDHVADAQVADVRGGQETPCPWQTHARREAGGLHGTPAFPAERHECGGGGHFVGATVVEDQDWRGRRCLWAEPSSGAVLTIRFHDVPLGTVIRGYGTLPWWVERELKGAPVSMEVVAGGESLGTYVHRDGDGWKPFEMGTRARAGTRADVEFRIQSARGHDRQFCFQADTR